MNEMKQISETAPPRLVEAIPRIGGGKTRLAVAGYCRVSTDDVSQETSIENQRLHYQRYIESNPDWSLAGIYWESGVSATRAETRPELLRLLEDCRAGRIDLVVTKSISRFSRNTADCLELVRHLTALGVALFFEKENLRTDEMHSEFFLSVLAALSQEESRSLSGNMKWAIRKRFRAGTYKGGKAPYGYRKTPDSRYLIEPGEAEVVRSIFRELRLGQSSAAIAGRLNAGGIPTWSAVRGMNGVLWSGGRVRQIAKNRFYVGDALYQKTYRDESYQQRVNRGELDLYLKEDAHPAIVDRESFDEANAAIARNAEKYGKTKAGNKRTSRYCFSGRICCGECGGKMYRSGSSRPSYTCQTHARSGQCAMKPVPEADICSAFATMLNKLAFALRCRPPLPIIGGEKEAAVSRIDEALAANRRCRDALGSRIQAEGHTSALLREQAALDWEERQLSSRKEKLCAADGAEELRRAVEHRGLVSSPGDADEELFRRFVHQAVPGKDAQIEFRFFCGLRLKESLRRRQPRRALPVFAAFTLAEETMDADGGAGQSADPYARILPLRSDGAQERKEA